MASAFIPTHRDGKTPLVVILRFHPLPPVNPWCRGIVAVKIPRRLPVASILFFVLGGLGVLRVFVLKPSSSGRLPVRGVVVSLW